MTTTDNVLFAPWSPIYDYPRVGAPHNSRGLIDKTILNRHGLPVCARVEANRTNTRWWLIILHPGGGTMSCYRTTTSVKLKDAWIRAIEKT